MVRKIVSATVSAALCLASVTPAFAQSNNLSPGEVVRAPLGATGALNLRIPLGAGPELEEPTYGLTFGMGRLTGVNAHGGAETSEVRLADIRFNSNGLRRANVASFDLANLDQDSRFDGLAGGEDNTLWIVVGLVAAGVAVCLLADCFEDDDNESSSSN